jgi:hypothetical protein
MKYKETFLIILLIICLYLVKAELIKLVKSSFIAFSNGLAIFQVFFEETFNFLMIETINGMHNFFNLPINNKWYKIIYYFIRHKP